MTHEIPLFVHRQAVQFVDTDMAGIVHFSNFFRYMEAAEDAFLRSLGISLVSKGTGRHVSLPRLAAEANFRAPIRYPDLVDIEVRIAELREKTIRYRFTFSVGDQPTAEGSVLAICCEMTDRLKSIPFPAETYEALERYRAAHPVKE